MLLGLFFLFRALESGAFLQGLVVLTVMDSLWCLFAEFTGT